MNINYAYVRFISDDEKLIVPVNHIKKFGKYYPDEKENRKYNVKYTNGDYYPAQILCVAGKYYIYGTFLWLLSFPA